MAKVLMLKTVYDGKVYHKAGEKVEISEEKFKSYIERGFAKEFVVEWEDKNQIIDSPVQVPTIETKEQKFKKKKK